LRFLDFCQRREHDRQPATCVVVMPGSMMMAVIAKHCRALIPERPNLVNPDFSRSLSTDCADYADC